MGNWSNDSDLPVDGPVTLPLFSSQGSVWDRIGGLLYPFEGLRFELSVGFCASQLAVIMGALTPLCK